MSLFGGLVFFRSCILSNPCAGNVNADQSAGINVVKLSFKKKLRYKNKLGHYCYYWLAGVLCAKSIIKPDCGDVNIFASQTLKTPR